MKTDQHLFSKLQEREASGSLRKLSFAAEGMIDFYSNDYLGIARIPFDEHASVPRGSTGSRLISGNSQATESLESMLAEFHGFEAALLFNSGYTANLGLFSALSTRGTVVIYDELIHASVRDGLRMGLGKSYSFRHNDLKDLERLLDQNSSELCYVAVESVYSMDGDASPVKLIAELCLKHKALLIVDEAHGIGVVGGKGEGLVSSLGLQQKVFASVYTFGKALGSHGAIVAGSKMLREYLVNFSRPFIYSTFLPPSEVNKIADSYKIMIAATDSRKKLAENIRLFSSLTGSKNEGPIHIYLVPGNEEVSRVAEKLSQQGFAVKPIKSPTVKQGEERLRICLHSFNTSEEITSLVSVLKEQLTLSC